MLDGIYDYFFGNDAQSTATGSNGNNQDASEWIFVDQESGRSSPVMVADLEMEIQEIKDEDIDSTMGEKNCQANRQRLRKMRKEISNQAKKEQVRQVMQRRKEIEKTLFEDTSGGDSSSASSSPITPPISNKHLSDGLKPIVQRKKKCVNIKQPKGSKGDNRPAAK